MKKIDTFSEFKKSIKIEEKIIIDTIPVDNTLYSLVMALIRENKSDELILSYFYSLGVDLERVKIAIEYCRSVKKCDLCRCTICECP